jgi:apolipoprotein N-acyltransferase
MNVFWVILSGLLSGLAFDHPALSWLIWFSLVPLLFVMREPLRPGRLFGLGCLAGIVHGAVSVFWLRHVTVPGTIALVFYMSLYWGVFALAGRRFLRTSFAVPALACLWVVLEWVKVQWGYFGWNLFGYSQAAWPVLIRSAAVAGVWFISFVIVCVNVLLFEAISVRRSLRTLRNAVVLAFVFILSWLLGTRTIDRAMASSESLSVTLIQPNVTRAEKDGFGARLRILDRLRKLTLQARTDTLLIYPEAAWPGVLDDEDRAGLFTEFVRSLERPSLFGAVERLDGRYYNSVLMVESDAVIAGRYPKIRLVPFGEFVPLRSWFSFIDALNEVGDMSPGTGPVLFGYKGAFVAPVICFEDVFPEMVAGAVRAGATVLVNVTDDSWFGGHPQAWQHLLIARVRAIENARSLIRAANTGVSCVILADGSIRSTVIDAGRDVFVTGITEAEVPVSGELTPYSRFPSVFPLTAALLLGACLLKSRRNSWS